jgi:hypothetical protein
MAVNATAHSMLAVVAAGKVALVDLKRFHQSMNVNPR